MHAGVEKPEEIATNLAAYEGRNRRMRLGDMLKERTLWLEVRDLFGGNGAFMSLPPQRGSDKHIVESRAEALVPGSVCLMWHGERWMIARGRHQIF